MNGPPFTAPNPTTLPSILVQGETAFAVTGIDFAGPFPVCDSSGKQEPKAYSCIFSSTTSRAIHLELVEELTTANIKFAL